MSVLFSALLAVSISALMDMDKLVSEGLTPPQAVSTVLKQVLMCPSIFGCAEVVTQAIEKYPEHAKDIVTAAIVSAPACETEIIQGAILAGLDPGDISQATAAGRRPPSPFAVVGVPELGTGEGGVTSAS